MLNSRERKCHPPPCGLQWWANRSKSTHKQNRGALVHDSLMFDCFNWDYCIVFGCRCLTQAAICSGTTTRALNTGSSSKNLWWVFNVLHLAKNCFNKLSYDTYSEFCVGCSNGLSRALSQCKGAFCHDLADPLNSTFKNADPFSASATFRYRPEHFLAVSFFLEIYTPFRKKIDVEIL